MTDGTAWPFATGEMANQIRAFDWAATAVGPSEDWPAELRSGVVEMLASPLVHTLVCGPERLLLYNDAAARLYGERHPAALGKPIADGWPDEYAKLGGLYDDVFAGQSLHLPAQPLNVSDRGGEVFDAYLQPLRDASGAVIAARMTGFEIGERVRAEAERDAALRRFETLAAVMPAMVWSGLEDRTDWLSRAWYDYTGTPEGKTVDEAAWSAVVHPDDREATLARARASLASGTPYEVEYRLRAADGRYRWHIARAQRVPGAQRWVGAATDIDDIQRLRQHERVLLAELQHRVRNTLANVRSIARRTAESSTDLEEFVSHFDGRLAAFARTQTHVTRDPARGIDLEGILADELLAHSMRDSEQVHYEGPEVRLTPKQADTLGLALHELVTNSVKYGALGSTEGRLRVRWDWRERAGERHLHLGWRELLPPGERLPGRPSRAGFGTELLERTLAYELDAETELDFRPEGLVAEIAIPV